MAPLAREAVARFPAVQRVFSEFNLHVAAVGSAYLGGNIMLGDLTTVEDHVRFLAHWQQEGRPIDLAILPSSGLLRFDKDIRGDSYRWITRLLKIPVEVLECRQIIL
jgi:hypothetical protein